MPAHAVAVPQARRLLHEVFDAQDIEARRRPDIDLAVTECFTNAVRHAYRGGAGSIDLVIDVQRGDQVDVTVIDYGMGMDSGPSADPGAGKGLELMAALAVCELTSTPGGGTTVRLHFAHASTAGRGRSG